MSNRNLPSIYIDFDIADFDREYTEAKEIAEAEASVFLTLREGDNQLRIIPPPSDWAAWFAENERKPSPFFDFWKHFYLRPGTKNEYVSFPCPSKMAGLPCEACEESARLRASRDAADNAIGESMQPKHRFLMNVIDRDHEQAGPKVYEGSYPWSKWNGKSAFERITNHMRGRSAVNLITPGPQGRDLVIKRTGTRADTSYDYHVARDPSPLSRDPEQAAAWIRGQHDLREYVRIPTSQQVSALLSGAAKNLGDFRDQQPQVSSAQAKPKAIARGVSEYVSDESDFGDDDITF
jgi:hypothetical protein